MGQNKGTISDFYDHSRLEKCWSGRNPECSSGEHPPESREDGISVLPDEILLLILSFLTCKEMAQTSLISRRWLNLWMHTRVLQFDGPFRYGMVAPSRKERQDFVNGVNHVLKLHQSQSLNEFRVTFFLNKCHKKDISSWLGYALKRGVQKLELNFLIEGRHMFDFEDAYDFSDRFLKLKSEKAIEVANPDRRGNCFVKCLDFISLKSLSFKGMKVTSEAVDFILRNCPFLERLEVIGSLDLDELVISDPKLVLKYLHVEMCDRLKFVSISNINLINLIISTEDLKLSNLPVLVDLSLTGTFGEVRHLFSQSSCYHSQLRSLTIDAGSPEDITQLSELARVTILKRVVIKIVAWGDDRLTELVPFIEACPYLEEFVLMARSYLKIIRSSREVAKAERRPLKSLKAFEFMGYYGREGHLELVMHILENGVALEKIILDPCCTLNIHPSPGIVEEARSVALQQFEGLRESIQTRIVIR